MSQASPAAEYGLARMLEDTVTAPLRPATVFSSLAGKPAPSYAVMIPNILVFCALGYAAGFVRAGLVTPAILEASPALTAIAALAAMVLAVPASFLAAGVMHAFMLLSGGEEDFQRSYQATSLLSTLLVLQSLLNWFDWTWALPAALGAGLAALAARFLHRAPAARAAVVFSLLGVCAVSGQWWARREVSQLAETAKTVRTAAAAAQDLGRQLQQAQQLAPPLERGTGPVLPAPSPEQIQTLWSGPVSSASLPAVISGLQLLLPPATGAWDGPADARRLQTQAQAQTQYLQQATSGMLAPIMGMLNNPAMTRNLPPDKAQQVRALTSLINQLQASMASGKKLTPEENAAVMAQMQGSVLQLMSQFSAMNAARQGAEAATGTAQKRSRTRQAAPAPKPESPAPAPAAAPAQRP